VLHGRQVRLPSEPALHEVVSGHARRRPDSPALTCGPDVRLSYAQLDARASQFAHYLRGAGVGRGSIVGVCVERSAELMIAILGILKAGAAYVPLDPTYPPDRLRLMVAQLPQMGLIAVTPATAELVPGAEHLDMAALGPRLSELPETAPPGGPCGADLCYVVFTSGSTGTPKAVPIDHRGWYNLLFWLQDEYGLGPQSSGLVLSSFGFDMTQRALMLPLFNGACLHLLPGRHADARLAYRLISETSVATLHCAPSMIYLLAELESERARALSGLTYLFIGGEPLNVGRIAGWAASPANGCKVANVYGVAECTDISSAHLLSDFPAYLSGPLPAGRAIHNTQVLILTPGELSEVPDGETGEICVTGTGVGPGYLNASPADARRYTTMTLNGGAERMYRTGDLGYLRDDGELILVGRVDAQVKIRGTRIDLGDVEAAIRRHPLVRDVAVLALPDASGETGLVAALLPANGRVDTRGLRRDLLGALPGSMIPRQFYEVADFPLNPNGKIDRPALARRLELAGPAD
jgi:amino acid adenylation domain-containing protein